MHGYHRTTGEPTESDAEPMILTTVPKKNRPGGRYSDKHQTDKKGGFVLP